MPSWQAPRRAGNGVCSTGCAWRLVRVAHAAAPSFSPGAARSSIARGLIRVRRIERVRLHADLTILARLATSLVKARTGPPAG